MSELDLITVKVQERDELPAAGADVFVTIHGVSLVSGGQALEKAREVALLVRELSGIDIGQEDIHLQGVTADVSTGTIMKTSQATYRLRVQCARLEKLPDILGVITGQKNTAISHIQWLYPNEESVRELLLEQCVTRAHRKARKIASGLGVSLSGVHSFTDDHLDPEGPRGGYAPEPPTMRARSMAPAARVTGEELGMEIAHAKTVQIQITVQYRVTGYRGEVQDAQEND